MSFNHREIEQKWQGVWESKKTFKTEIDHSKEKYYALDMFPYPSGSGLHVGHPEGYTATDIVSRYKRMKGFNVLHCMGWDAFGLPAEQVAVKTGLHPKHTTEQNINNFRRQIKSLGFSYDWDREIDTTDPGYYKWTQWIFLQLMKTDLAYQKDAPVNWCPALNCVLANEEVIDGKSEIGGHPVVRKNLRQWCLKITSYADKLLDDLGEVDWPTSIKEMQVNWIGKSFGANINFGLENTDEKLVVYTTRPDTLYGATFCVLAPEHRLVEKLTTNERKAEIQAYIDSIQSKSEMERASEANEKTGVFTGGYAINPSNGEKIPVWISDYVLISYGTGSIMSVPAHDQRDHDFARKFGLPILPVVDFEHDYQESAQPAVSGKMINSPVIDGLPVSEAKEKMIDYLQKKGLGKRKTVYRMRDWLFSRQRYWGEPIPVLLDEDFNATPLDENELPLLLPHTENFMPSDTGESPLSNLEEWLKVEKEGKNYMRETNTMPQWAGSCWYYLRFTDPRNHSDAWSKEAENYWMPVDLYIGGAEHAVLHLLYSRFWHKVLYDLGFVSTKEPFKKLVNQGMILGPDSQKMSKSRGNVINPDGLIHSHGSDSLRLYEMFMGPLEKVKPWQEHGIDGCRRFLNKVWAIGTDNSKPPMHDSGISEQECKLLHPLIKKVGDDIENLRFNTAIAAMMTFVNNYSSFSEKSKECFGVFLQLLNPFAPHLTEELWDRLGKRENINYHPWPRVEEKYLAKEGIVLPVQINGKLRGQLEIEPDLSEEQVMALVNVNHKINKYLEGKPIRKIIYKVNRILNIVV